MEGRTTDGRTATSKANLHPYPSSPPASCVVLARGGVGVGGVGSIVLISGKFVGCFAPFALRHQKRSGAGEGEKEGAKGAFSRLER